MFASQFVICSEVAKTRNIRETIFPGIRTSRKS